MRLGGVVWDLDDTLALERDYVRSGFRAVADAVSRYGVDPDSAFTLLWGDFEAGVRGDAFDRLLAASPGLARCATVAELVTVYREHRPDLALTPGIGPILDALAERGVRQGVVSDGPLASQAAKATALGLARWCDPIILTDAWGREFWKPHARAFETIQAAWRLRPDELVYVGDNPAKDFVAPARLGWHTVRLRLPQQVRFSADAGAHPADVTLNSVAELDSWLAKAT